MTFILERVRSISTQFLCICLHDTKMTIRSRTSHSRMSSFRFSFPKKFSFRYEISFWYHVHWYLENFVLIENRKIGSLERVAHEYLIWRANHAGENALDWPVRFHVNAVRTSFWNESHSGIVLTAPMRKNRSCKMRSLTYSCVWQLLA